MPSPFPGMDPFIEVNPRWEGFHAWFVRELARQALPKAQELGCWIDVERMVYQREPNGEVVLIGGPDETVAVDPSSPGWSSPAPGAVALADPEAIHEVILDPDSLERFKQDYLVVRELGQFARVLAAVEVLSPANKSGKYVPRYREKRLRWLAGAAHFMEIDLLRAGDNPSRRLFPELPSTPYFILVARKTGLGRNEEGYPLRLPDSLPVIGLPLGPPRPDLPLDLAAAFRAAYDLSIRPGSIRYAEETPPAPPLDKADAAWVKSVVQTG
ncbi:MAG: DUF4058 family protein [Pirellulales bacterium]|nr:DUF4058 family protein [Pirellulales bacterium]